MTFKVKGDWVEQSKLIQQTFPQLTDEDMKFSVGKELDLLERVERRLKLSREDVMKILSKAFPRKSIQIRFKTRRNLTNRN